MTSSICVNMDLFFLTNYCGKSRTVSDAYSGTSRYSSILIMMIGTQEIRRTSDASPPPSVQREGAVQNTFGIGQQTGIDTAAHMSEEVKNAAKTSPRAILSVLVNDMCLIFLAIVTIVYHIPDLDAALEDSTTYFLAQYVLKRQTSGVWSVGSITALMAVIF